MEAQKPATLVVREAEASKPKSEDPAKVAVVDPSAPKVDANAKKAAKRSAAAHKNTAKTKSARAHPSKPKKTKKTVLAHVQDSSSSDSDADSSDSSSSSDVLTDSGSSDSDGDTKKLRSKKRRDAAKTKRRVRSKKPSKKPIKVQELSESGSESESEDPLSDSESDSEPGSSSDTDGEFADGGARRGQHRHPHQHQQQQHMRQDLSRLMLQQHPPPIPAFNPYQQYVPPFAYGAPMGTPMGFAGGAPPYYPPPPPPPPLQGLMTGRRLPPVQQGRHQGRLGGLGDLGDDILEDCGRHRKRSKHKRASKAKDFKRVDQVWDNAIHNYKLQDTAEGSTDAEYEGYLFHVRRTFDWEGKYKKTVVDIKSTLLREALKDVIGNVKGVSLVEETPKLDPNLLFLFLDDIRQHAKTLKNTEPTGPKKNRKKEAKRIERKRQQLKVLIRYLDNDYEAVKNSLHPLLENGLITFDLLWALWKPNTLAFTTTYGSADQPRVFKAEMAEKHWSIMKGDFYYIEGKYFEYDGKRFGFGSVADEIPEFQGARKITSLPLFPLKYHKNEKQIREELVARGKKFVALSGVQYRSYDGMAYYKKKKAAIKVNISGRIMIDSSIHRRINPNYPISLVRPKDHDALSGDEGEGTDAEWGDGGEYRSGSDREDGRERLLEEKEPIALRKVPKKDGDLAADAVAEAADDDADKAPPEFSDEEYLIASPVVLGFAFAEKLWLELTVSSVKDIQWNENAYQSLVLEPKTKDIVKALVESHKYHAAESIDDVIQGKGKGLVAVLHGPPGTGKTLTAEGISELLKCPLYMVSAGELGTDSRFLESELQRILDICHAWGAILLLDEADVFLEKRNMHDLHRNALVSIFLRQLEYFQGILFLTTNRVETFDDAFQSRIHIALRYDSLDHRAKKAIFKIFIERVRVLEKIDLMPFSEEDYNALARHELNGRQIKNTVRTAQALAVNKREPLSMGHIRQVLDVQMSFDRDLKGGPGFQDAMRSYF